MPLLPTVLAAIKVAALGYIIINLFRPKVAFPIAGTLGVWVVSQMLTA